MSLTKKQTRILERTISKIYGRNYIPLTTPDGTFTIGDVLASKNDTVPIIDSSMFPVSSVSFTQGCKMNCNITSSSEVDISLKLKGEAVLSDFFKIDEAGLAVNFNSDNQMFLKVIGLRQQSMTNFIEFRNELLSLYKQGKISARSFAIRGIVYADQYYLQFSGSRGGTIGLSLMGDVKPADIDVDANFSIKWKKEVGFSIDGTEGGVLAYRVSGIRFKRHMMPDAIQKKVLDGISETNLLDKLSISERTGFIKEDALEIVDLTNEVIFSEEMNED